MVPQEYEQQEFDILMPSDVCCQSKLHLKFLKMYTNPPHSGRVKLVFSMKLIFIHTFTRNKHKVEPI
uniref:Uncharacterized protein n=1 Tax=Anopheles minimus TaxID=112268 RepID=A0A182WQG3_9DIPT